MADNQTTAQAWDEDAACALVGAWLHRIGAGWPQGMSAVEGEAGRLWDHLESDLETAFLAEDWETLRAVYAEFREGFKPLWRTWTQGQNVARKRRRGGMSDRDLEAAARMGGFGSTP